MVKVRVDWDDLDTWRGVIRLLQVFGGFLGYKFEVSNQDIIGFVAVLQALNGLIGLVLVKEPKPSEPGEKPKKLTKRK